MILYTNHISNLGYQIVDIRDVLGAHSDGVLDERETLLELLSDLLCLCIGLVLRWQFVCMSTDDNHGAVVGA